MGTFTDDHRCFVCGPGNPAGLRLEFHALEPGPAAGAEVVFPDHLQGWQGTVHGGLLATVLDEAMIKAAMFAGIRCVTGELNVKYRKPAVTGQAYRASGQVLSTRGRLVLAEGSIQDADGQVYATATGRMVTIP